MGLVRHKLTKRSTTMFWLLAIGCLDPENPKGGWMRREGNKAKMGCNGSDTKWTLICDGTKWTGENNRCVGGILF